VISNSQAPEGDGEHSTDERPERAVIVPYLWVLALAGLVSLFLLAYLWLLLDEIIAVIRQAAT
jgi:hypothetical protein